VGRKDEESNNIRYGTVQYSTFMSIYLGGNEMRIKSMVKSRTMGVEAQKMTTAEVSWGSWHDVWAAL